MANNTYIMAKVLVEAGHDLRYIRDDHTFLFSQPFWEDLPCTASYEEVRESATWGRERVHRLEERLGWIAPPWLEEIPVGPPAGRLWFPAGPGGPARRLAQGVLERKFTALAPVRERLAGCEVALVCGEEGVIAAGWCGRPFIIWPHGEELRVAAGKGSARGGGLRVGISRTLRAFLIRGAFARAAAVGTHMPIFFLEDQTGTERFVRDLRVEFLPLPVAARPRSPVHRRRKDLALLFNELGLEAPGDELTIFVPSRVDFRWKGTDRLVEAVAELSREGIDGKEARFIFAGWGDDYHRAREALGAGPSLFLPCALSKPYLLRLFSVVDLVVDQLVMGCYGTAAVEAMGAGTPVVMYVDERFFRERGWEPPPVINARSSSDVARLVREVLDGHRDLEADSAEAVAWVERRHGREVFLRRLEEILGRERWSGANPARCGA